MKKPIMKDGRGGGADKSNLPHLSAFLTAHASSSKNPHYTTAQKLLLDFAPQLGAKA